jgi:hypothetical protein
MTQRLDTGATVPCTLPLNNVPIKMEVLFVILKNSNMGVTAVQTVSMFTGTHYCYIKINRII